MALHGHEEAILDLLDQGMTQAEIISRGFPPARVRFTASSFGSAQTNRAADRRREEAIRRGSSALLAAIQQERRA